jgi:glycosyltransferase involved in cell wall biosynthesis
VNFRGPLIAEMVRRGHRVCAVAPAMDDATAGELRAIGAASGSLPLSNTSLSPLSLLRSLGAVRRLVRDHRPDVIISYTIKPVILAGIAGRLEQVPRVVALITGAGFAFTGGRELRRKVSRIAARLLYRLALARSDFVIFQNRDDLGLFEGLGLVEGGKAAVVNGSGIDVDRFAVAPLPVEPGFLMIARLLGDKGVREYGAAAAQLKARDAAVRVRLAGYLDPSPDSIGQRELDAMTASGIEFLGRLEDVRPAIANCSVYVLPSYREGTPRSVLEAMAMGRAIITTDAPGCRETVEEGVNGFLVPPRDADALCRAMTRFIDQPELAGRMGEASRRIAEAKFDVRKVNAEILRHAGL